MFLFDITKIVHPSSLMDYHHFLHHSMALAWREDHLFSANPCRVVDYLIRFIFFLEAHRCFTGAQWIKLLILCCEVWPMKSPYAVISMAPKISCAHTHTHSYTQILIYYHILKYLYLYIYIHICRKDEVDRIRALHNSYSNFSDFS